MEFGWINLINAIAVAYLIIVNVIAFKMGVAHDMKSKSKAVNALEQTGRYGCMALMILPVVKNLSFGFKTDKEFVVWMFVTPIILLIYGNVWLAMGMLKKQDSKILLLLLAILPVCLFVLNGILLRHLLLVVVAVLFGIFHLWIVWENYLGKDNRNENS